VLICGTLCNRCFRGQTSWNQQCVSSADSCPKLVFGFWLPKDSVPRYGISRTEFLLLRRHSAGCGHCDWCDPLNLMTPCYHEGTEKRKRKDRLPSSDRPGVQRNRGANTAMDGQSGDRMGHGSPSVRWSHKRRSRDEAGRTNGEHPWVRLRNTLLLSSVLLSRYLLRPGNNDGFLEGIPRVFPTHKAFRINTTLCSRSRVWTGGGRWYLRKDAKRIRARDLGTF
jgi:hypothetical protein